MLEVSLFLFLLFVSLQVAVCGAPVLHMVADEAGLPVSIGERNWASLTGVEATFSIGEHGISLILFDSHITCCDELGKSIQAFSQPCIRIE